MLSILTNLYCSRKEQVSIAERGFIENYFNCGLGESDLKENYRKSIDLLVERYFCVDDLSEKVINGVIVDLPTLNQSVLELIFFYRYAEKFKHELSGTDVINPLDIVMSSDLEQNYIRGEFFLKK